MRRLVGALVSVWVAALFLPPGATVVATGRGMSPAPDVGDLRAILSPPRSGPIGLQADVVDHTAMVTEASYPVLDARGDSAGSQRWRIVYGTGNCCENYLASNDRGRLFDFGGDYLYFTDDEGLTWKRVEPADPLPNFGEGAVAVAPDGDIVGVAWNPYHGDRVVPFKYEVEEETWYYTTTKLHQPFFDRESLAVIPGPFTFAGETHPYVVLLKGGWPAKDPWFVSFDGLNYIVPSAKFADQITEGSRTGWLDFKGTPAHDWLQTNYQTRVTALGKGTGIASRSNYIHDNEALSADFVLLTSDNLKWKAFTFKGDQIEGHLLTDSKGRLHYVYTAGKAVVYLMSADGGRSWEREVIRLPKGSERSPDVDFRANGRLDLTAIAVHFHSRKEGVSQDVVHKLSTAGNRIELLKTYLIGQGDLVTGSGVASSAPRFDFSTITFLPDGRVAVSFIDKEHRTPTLAIQMRR